MIKRMFGALLVLALVGVFSTSAFAQQAPQEMKKEAPKTEMKKDEMAKKEHAMGPVQSFDCGTECAFMVRSNDEKELMSAVKSHLKKHHKMEPSDKELKAMLKSQPHGEMKHN